MNLFTTVPLEPIPISSNSAITTFSINPALPEGLLLDSASGTISGSVASTATTGTTYTVTATNSLGSTTTTVSFNIKDVADMTMGGFVACYWAGITECLTPSFNYFYKNAAQYCQHESKINFSDTWASELGSVWPGLDYRFLDYFSAYMYGYFNIQTPGTYTFYFTSDDGALFYLDDLESIFIDREGCRGSSTTTGTKTLTRGRHIFAIRFFEFNEAAVLKVEFESSDASISRMVADSNYLKVGGRGPTFISYPVVSGFTNADITTYQPTMSSGGATSWQINPPLPSGLSIDPTNGYISGRPNSVANSVHTVTASGYTGSGEAVVRVVIAAQPVTGLYTKYYTISDASFCSYKALSGNQIDIKVIKIDDNINHPNQNPIIPWTGLTADFSANFYVVWEGYLYHDAIGEWGMRITCDDGCKLLSTNNNELINHWGCHGYTSKDTTRAISSVGYYYYKIEYQQSGGAGGMRLEWRKPGEGWTDIPSDKMFHSPTSVVSYQYEMAHYFVNVPIEENRPIFFGTNTYSNFQVSPALPTGLVINPSTGIITGTPTTEINIGEYTITCTSGANTEKVIISMDVFFVLPPSGLSLTQGGLSVTTVTLNAFTAMTSITVVKSDPSVTVTSYSISPELPAGLTINSSTGTISGTPTVSLEATPFVVSATNSGGQAFLQFTLTVVGCKGVSNGQPWTNSYYTLKMFSGSSATVSLLTAGEAVSQCGTGSTDSNGNAILSTCSSTVTAGASITYCFKKEDVAKLRVVCTDEVGCRYQLTREDGHYFPALEAYDPLGFPPFTQTTDFPNTLPALTTITLSPASEINVYTGYPMDTISLSLNGAYKSISISPVLGEGFDLTDPKISGMVYSSGSINKVYTITATGEAGTATATLTLNFVECSEENGVGVITFEKQTYSYGNEESYTVSDSDGNVLLSASGFAAYSSYTNVLCLRSGTYNVHMMDTYGDAWGDASLTYLRVKDPSGTLIKEMSFVSGTGDSTNKNKYDSFSVIIVESAKVQWKVRLGKYDRDWYSPDYDSSKWEVKNNGIIGNWDGVTTAYFIYEFNLEDAFQYPLLQFSVYYRDGIAVYLNGQNVYLRNLPEKFNQNTGANGHYDDYYKRVGTAPGHQLRDGKNVVAIEMHKFASTGGDIYWSAYVVPLQGTCITRIDSGTITESPAFNQATETAAAAWDRSTGTNWIENALPAWTVWSYNYDRVEWVNKVILGSAKRYPESDPTEINIYGSNDGTSWDLMKNIKQVGIWSSRGETKEFMMMDHLNAYGHYKVEITKSYNGAGRTGLSVIDLQSCQLVYCTDNDHVWPGTLAGQSVTIDCAEGYIGERTRVCGNEKLKPQWLEADERECRSLNPPKKTVYIDFAIAVTEVTVETMLTGGAEAITTVLGSRYPILLSEMEAWKVKDITDNSVEQPITTTAVWVRITRASEGAGDILKAVTNGLADIAKDLKEYKSDYYPETASFSFYMTPMLSERKNLSAISVTLIVILVIVVLILAVIIGFWIWVRTKSKKTKNGAKQLRAGLGNKVKAQHLSGKQDRV